MYMEHVSIGGFKMKGNTEMVNITKDVVGKVDLAKSEDLTDTVAVNKVAEKKRIETVMRLLSEYNIEVSITERNSSKKVFVWRKGSGNLQRGIVKTNQFMLYKLGCDLEDIIKEMK